MNIKRIIFSGAAAALLGISVLACDNASPPAVPAMRWEPAPRPLATDAAQAGNNIATYTAFGYRFLYQYDNVDFTHLDACDIASYMGFARLQLETAISDVWAIETWTAALRELRCIPDETITIPSNAG